MPAEREDEEVGDVFSLHLIILDEMDAMARKRGIMSADTAIVMDNVVNQLLAMINGVKSLPNVAALGERFFEARETSHSLLVLDGVDQIVVGNGKGGYSSVMPSTFRALMRTPPPSGDVARAGGRSKRSKTLHIIGTTLRSDAACTTINEIF